MSRRLLPSHLRVSSTSDDPHQPNTASVPIQPFQKPVHSQCGDICRNGPPTAPVDAELSDDTFTDSQAYYDYYQAHNHQHCNKGGCQISAERNFSDDSGSTRTPGYVEFDAASSRRLSRNTLPSKRSFGKRTNDTVNPMVHKDVRRVYPQHFAPLEGALYQEVPPRGISDVPSTNPIGRRLPHPALSDRPQSSMSSGVTSAIVDGCGGKCQTFENVCFFFLQLIFMMGILIGVSLCIAGLVLRKSATRNLQVLVYIGILLAIVSSVLLGIQWNARNIAKKRRFAVKNSKRAPIPLETLHPRNQLLQQQPLVTPPQEDAQRVPPQVLRSLPQSDQQGIPWWRRRDLS